jgi:hypothetical protein
MAMRGCAGLVTNVIVLADNADFARRDDGSARGR